MTQLWAYVGDLGPAGELDWGGTWSGNAPRPLAGLADLDRHAWSLALDYCRAGRFEGRQVDWGAYALRVNGPRLIAFLTEAYGASAIESRRPPLDAYIRLAMELGEEKFVALAAAEL